VIVNDAGAATVIVVIGGVAEGGPRRDAPAGDDGDREADQEHSAADGGHVPVLLTGVVVRGVRAVVRAGTQEPTVSTGR
jgi:hypothetical protein